MEMNANDPWVVDPKTLQFVNLNSTAIKELCLVVESILKKKENRNEHPAFKAWAQHMNTFDPIVSYMFAAYAMWSVVAQLKDALE